MTRNMSCFCGSHVASGSRLLIFRSHLTPDRKSWIFPEGPINSPGPPLTFLCSCSTALSCSLLSSSSSVFVFHSSSFCFLSSFSFSFRSLCSWFSLVNLPWRKKQKQNKGGDCELPRDIKCPEISHSSRLSFLIKILEDVFDFIWSLSVERQEAWEVRGDVMKQSTLQLLSMHLRPLGHHNTTKLFLWS